MRNGRFDLGSLSSVSSARRSASSPLPLSITLLLSVFVVAHGSTHDSTHVAHTQRTAPTHKKMDKQKKRARSAPVPRVKKAKMNSFELFCVKLAQFKRDGTGSVVDDSLVDEFPLFEGRAPNGHPYPQAFEEPPDNDDFCFLERTDGEVLLCRKLPSGRVIFVDTMHYEMLNNGYGIAHKNMDTKDNCIKNLMHVKEAEARAMLLAFTE